MSVENKIEAKDMNPVYLSALVKNLMGPYTENIIETVYHRYKKESSFFLPETWNMFQTLFDRIRNLMDIQGDKIKNLNPFLDSVYYRCSELNIEEAVFLESVIKLFFDDITTPVPLISVVPMAVKKNIEKTQNECFYSGLQYLPMEGNRGILSVLIERNGKVQEEIISKLDLSRIKSSLQEYIQNHSENSEYVSEYYFVTIFRTEYFIPRKEFLDLSFLEHLTDFGRRNHQEEELEQDI